MGFLKKGALSLRGPHDPTQARLADDHAYMIEMVDATDRLGADFVTVSVLHASAWTILPHKMNNRNTYPENIVNDWCRDKVKANACMQYRTDHYPFPEDVIDEANRLCESAPDGDLRWGCYSGAEHSENIMKPCLDRDIRDEEYYCSPAIKKAAWEEFG